MTNKERFLAGHKIKLSNNSTFYYYYQNGVIFEHKKNYPRKENFYAWTEKSNEDAISCYTIFFKIIVKAELLFDEMIFIEPLTPGSEGE